MNREMQNYDYAKFFIFSHCENTSKSWQESRIFVTFCQLSYHEHHEDVQFCKFLSKVLKEKLTNVKEIEQKQSQTVA